MKFLVLLMAILSCSLDSAAAFTPSCLGTIQRKSTTSKLEAKQRTADAPPLARNPPRKVCLMVEPTPFTHVSGYANRFKEMLKFMKKAGDSVEILTVDSKTEPKDLPRKFMDYKIHHTQGFTFPLYNQISLTVDLPEMKGARIVETFKPDLIHVTSPGFMLFASIFYARVMCIPLVMSYHTHLPTYGEYTSICCYGLYIVYYIVFCVLHKLSLRRQPRGTHTCSCSTLHTCILDRQELLELRSWH